MRAADVEELFDLGLTPTDALLRSIRGSRDAWAGLVDGRVACIFGVYPLTTLGSEAFPWLLASDLMVQHAKMFLRLNRPYITQLRKDFKWLHNYVSARNLAAIRWLRWLGFVIDERPVLLGPKRAMMLHFEMRP